MNIFHFRHPKERIALSISLLVSLFLVVFFPIPALTVLFFYVISIYLWQNWLVNQALKVEFKEDSDWGENRLQLARKLKLEFIPSVMRLEPDRWDHRLVMLILRGRFIFLLSSFDENLKQKEHLQLAWKMSEVAGQYGAWWHNFVTFFPRMIPFLSSYLAKAEVLTIDRLTKYALEEKDFSFEELPEEPLYNQKQTGIFWYALADAWKERILPWLIKYLGDFFAKWPQPNQRENFLRLFDPAIVTERIATQSSPVSTSNLPTDEINTTHTHINPIMSNSKKINPAVTTIIGLITGVPLSYFFQSENLRGKLSMGDYITKLPDLFERAMRDDSYWSIFVTLGISVVIFGLLGYGIAYLLNRR